MFKWINSKKSQNSITFSLSKVIHSFQTLTLHFIFLIRFFSYCICTNLCFKKIIPTLFSPLQLNIAYHTSYSSIEKKEREREMSPSSKISIHLYYPHLQRILTFRFFDAQLLTVSRDFSPPTRVEKTRENDVWGSVSWTFYVIFLPLSHQKSENFWISSFLFFIVSICKYKSYSMTVHFSFLNSFFF